MRFVRDAHLMSWTCRFTRRASQMRIHEHVPGSQRIIPNICLLNVWGNGGLLIGECP